MTSHKAKYLLFPIGFIYLLFGFLKFFPELSPAEDLASNTLDVMTFGTLPTWLTYHALAILEVVLGVGLILRVYPKFFITTAIVHMCCTFIPLFVFPEVSFTEGSYGLTIVGQYIMKNIIIISALFMVFPRESKVA